MLESDLTDEQKVVKARENHVWVDAFRCVNPTDETCLAIGRQVMAKLNASDIDGDVLGVKIGKVLYMRVQKS